MLELLVVVLVLSVLAAVALPNLLGQIGKAKETEAKTGISAINRAQQAYHYERQRFGASATDVASFLSGSDVVDITDPSNPLRISIHSEFYQFQIQALQTIGGGNTTSYGFVLAEAIAPKDNGTRNYAGAVSFNGEAYEVTICQHNIIGAGTPSTQADWPTGYFQFANDQADCRADGEIATIR